MPVTLIHGVTLFNGTFEVEIYVLFRSKHVVTSMTDLVGGWVGLCGFP